MHVCTLQTQDVKPMFFLLLAHRLRLWPNTKPTLAHLFKVGHVNILALEAGSPSLTYFNEYEWTFLLAPGLLSAVLALSNRLENQTQVVEDRSA